MHKLARTQQFSQEVGGGHFDTPYEPLSDDDTLGKSLLQMRSSLAENERVEGKVQERTEELARQKARAEEILGDLQDSISYALRIQEAILPSEQQRREVFHESAVFYQPRDVVSGDFYWFKSVGSRRLVAAIDCTGHGVPGAFASGRTQCIGSGFQSVHGTEQGVGQLECPSVDIAQKGYQIGCSQHS